MSRLRRVLAISLMTGMLAACAAGPAPVDHFYRVEVAAASDPGGPRLLGTLHVDPLRTDGLTGQRSMLYRPAEGTAELRQYAYHQWADVPAVAVQSSLVRYLRDAGAAEVVMESNARIRPSYTISGRIHRFERVLRSVDGSDSTVFVDIDLTVTSADGDLLVHESYKQQRAASGLAGSASAVGVALHDIFERFLVDLGRSARRRQTKP